MLRRRSTPDSATAIWHIREKGSVKFWSGSKLVENKTLEATVVKWVFETINKCSNLVKRNHFYYPRSKQSNPDVSVTLRNPPISSP